MSDYSEENKDVPINYDDSGHMQTTETVAAANADDDGLDGPGLDIGAQIHLKLCAIKDAMDQQYADACRKEQARLDSQPNIMTFSKAVVLPAGTTPLVVSFGRPQLGRKWDVRSLMSMGQGQGLMDPSLVAAGAIAVWYVGVLPPPQADTVALDYTTQIRWYQNGKSGAPITDKIGPEQIMVSANENLYVIVVNSAGAGGANTPWILSATVADQPVKQASAVSLV